MLRVYLNIRGTILFRSPLLLLLVSVCGTRASSGDRSEDFSGCLANCRASGCAILPAQATKGAKGSTCIPDCIPPASGEASEGGAESKLLTTPWDLRALQWTCNSECKYQCMLQREATKNGAAPEKYYGKWPFKRVLGAQESASVLLSLLNLLAHAYGLLSLRRTVARLPLVEGWAAYPYTGLWHLYALFNINAWLWSAVFHARDCKVTEQLDYYSAAALFGFSLIVALIRTLELRTEAAQVTVSAPIIGFTTTHIFALITFIEDYSWNMKVCLTMGALQLGTWAIWGVRSGHPSLLKLLFTILGVAGATALEVFDFPPYFGVFDAHSLWHAATVPLVLLWWSWVNDDARYVAQKALKGKDVADKGKTL